jgi:hypothetical protein
VKDNAICPAFNEYPPVPVFKILHRFMLRSPVMVVAAKLVIVAELRFALFETVNALRVVVPTGTLNPPLETVTLFVTTNALRVVVPTGTLKAPLETVTLHPVPGCRTILEVAEIWTLDPELMDMEPNELV